jgi:glycosyltransferase involved in cell wall biosynthesis
MLAPQIFRALRGKGFDPAMFVCESGKPAYEDDPFEDFEQRGRLYDLKGQSTEAIQSKLFEICSPRAKRRPELILQVGAYRAYPWLPILKDQQPDIVIADMLYNPIGHTVDHFLYETAFDAVLVESQYMARYIRSCSTMPSKRVEIAHSGVDLNSFQPRVGRVMPGALTIGYIGRMSVEKNPLGFLQLAEEVGAALPATRLYMAGGGPQLDDVKSRAAKSKLGNRLTVAGFVADVRDAFALVDILAVPSKTDGRPVAVMEASALGKPVLAAPVGGLPEMIEEGVNGWVRATNDTQRMIEVLAPFVTGDQKLQQLQRATTSYAQTHFSYDAMIDGYAEIFRSLISGQTSHGHRITA